MKRRERLYLKLTNAAPGFISGRVDQLRPSYYAAGPLNEQRERQRIVRELIAAIGFDEVVETGTFRAASTLFFHDVSGCPVYTVELLERYFRFSTLRCAGRPDIHLHKGDSRAFLRGLAARIGHHTTLFYLDAHWESDVPRFEELELVAASWDRAVIIIDDFAVPDDAEYGFTHYDGQPLTLDYLPPLEGWTSFYPAVPAAEETGARRGCIVLASPDLGESVGRLRTLRRVIGLG